MDEYNEIGARLRELREVSEYTVEELQLQIDKTAQEVEEMSKTLKSKKADLKDLLKARERAEKYAAEAKAQEEQSRLLEAVEKSGKSIDEILAMLQ